MWNENHPDDQIQPGDGCCIHHIDGDKHNDVPENLLKLTVSDHMRLHQQERWNDPEYARAFAARTVALWKDPEYHQKQLQERSERAKRLWSKTEHRKKMSNHLKRLWEDPEYREKQRKSRIEAWKRRKAKART